MPTYAQAIFESIDFEADRYKQLKSVITKHITRIVGFVVDETIWHNQELEKHLVLNIKVVDEHGKILAIDKDIHKLKQKLKDLVQKPQRIVEDKVYNDWQFGTIEHTSQIREDGITIKVYNCLEEYQDGVRLGYKTTAAEAKVCIQNAVKKLVKLRLQSYLSKSNELNELFTDNYLTQPMPYLQRYKYYIQALENRLDKAKLNLQRDRAYQLEVRLS